MVKGISRQVILVHAPEPELFEQAIFILKDNASAVTDEMLLKEAKKIISAPPKRKQLVGPLWACAGAVLASSIWFVSIFL